MKRIIMLAGLPGTGKSTYANSLSLDGKVEIISSDEVRFSLTKAYNVILPDMNVVYDMMISKANDLMSQYENITVILDSTFLDDNRRNYFLDHLNIYDEINLVLLKVHDLNVLFKRNHMRAKEKWVPEDVLAGMMKKYANPGKEYEHRYSKIEEVYLDETFES